MSRLYRVRIPFLGTLVVLLVAIAATVGLAWWLQPTKMRLAVEAGSLPATEIFTRFAELSRRELGSLRLEPPLRVEDSAERARFVEEGRVDAAVFRLDEALPARASAVALVEGDMVIAIARANARVTRVGELAGKRVGVAIGHPGDVGLAGQLLESYGLERSLLRNLDEDRAAADAFVEGRIDALIVIGRPDGPRVRGIFARIGTRAGGAPVFLTVEHSVVRARQPHVEEGTIAASVIDPRRSVPSEEVTTVTIKRALLARSELSSSTVAALTRFLFERRDQLAASMPVIAALQPPSTDRGAALPVHAGAAEYIDANEMNFLTRYSDLIYLSLCFTGVFGSLWAALYTRYRFSERHGLTQLVAGIASAGKSASEAKDIDELCTLEQETARLVLQAAQNPRFAADEKTIGLLDFTFSAARVAIDSRRQELSRAAASGGGSGGDGKARRGELKTAAARPSVALNLAAARLRALGSRSRKKVTPARPPRLARASAKD